MLLNKYDISYHPTGLKKVTDDMKTHKNPALRKQGSIGSGGSGVRAGPAPFKASAGPPKPAPKPNKNAAPAAKPPVFELQMKKWVIVSIRMKKWVIISIRM